MNKPVLGLLAGGVLGAIDGLSALVSAPEVAPGLAVIVTGSDLKRTPLDFRSVWHARRSLTVRHRWLLPDRFVAVSAGGPE